MRIVNTFLLAALLATVYLYLTKPRGGLDYGVGLDISLIKCDEGEPYYGMMATDTSFSTMMQTIEVSWQCHENSGARKYIRSEPYHLSISDGAP